MSLARVGTPHLAKTALTWFFTVRSDLPSTRAISRLLRPWRR